MTCSAIGLEDSCRSNREALWDAAVYHYTAAYVPTYNLVGKPVVLEVRVTRRFNVPPELKTSVPTHASAHLCREPPSFEG